MKLPDFIKKDVLLARHSTLGVGGPADYFAVIKNDQATSKQPFGLEAKFIEACEFARDNSLEVFVLGQGSNILFGDKGFRGLILKIDTHDIWFTDVGNKKELWVDAGTPVTKLVDFAKSNGLSGFEFLAGLPGTVGGAVYGNAGCYGGEFWDVIEEIMFFDGEYINVNKKDFSMFSYRQSIFKDNPSRIILGVKLIQIPGDKEKITKKTTEIFNKRFISQPKARNVGCVFKNPALSNKLRISAGMLIDKTNCLKGLRIGGAMISREHGNFFVNRGDAKAKDFIKLIEIVKGEVLKKFAIELKEETIRVGEF